jgi:NhaA family Na+:H+ antiporter
MTTYAHSHALHVPHRRHHTVAWLRFLNERFLWLPLGAAFALVWANWWPESYFRSAHALAFPVNEIGMAIFLGLVTQEALEAVMPGGALAAWRRWAMPLVAATGGLIGSTFFYLAYITLKHEQVLAPAWPIACAIDIAAGYYVLKTIFRGSAAPHFMLVLGIATNAVGLLILAVWPAFTPDHLGAAILLVVAVALAATIRRWRVRVFSPYLLACGTLSWAAFYWAGVHPALALVPIVPFLPHRPRPGNPFADPSPDGVVHRAEHEWNAVVQIVLFLFGVVNAGVLLRGADTGSSAVVIAALVGRPLGVIGGIALGVALGLRLPGSLTWRDVTVIALATTSGFTFALFAATSLLPPGAVLTQIKVGALATAAGALVTYGAARLLLVGRFARPPARASGGVIVGYRLEPGQPITHEVRRIAARQIELAIEGLTNTGTGEHDDSVHTARRHIKKVRALIRLVRPAMGRRSRSVTAVLRVVSQLLAPIADGQATVDTLARVATRHGSHLPSDVAATVCAWLVRRESMAYEDAALCDTFETAVGLLRASRDAVDDWHLRTKGFHAVGCGLKRTARAGARAMARAKATSRSGDYHAWRQRVKDQWLQVRLLQARCGGGLALDERRLEALDGYLGECHNCAILREVLTADSMLSHDDAARCLRAVRRHERQLRRCARRLGKAIYHETPNAFVTRVRRLWRRTRRTPATSRRGTPWQSAA